MNGDTREGLGTTMNHTSDVRVAVRRSTNDEQGNTHHESVDGLFVMQALQDVNQLVRLDCFEGRGDEVEAVSGGQTCAFGTYIKTNQSSHAGKVRPTFAA
ncbi:MAG: hypothetical protein RLZZ314_829 [Bacteroidota bacterium]